MSRKTPNKSERINEEEYFHRLDVELIDQMRKRQLAEMSHIKDQAVLGALAGVGFNHGNAMLLHLVPLIHVAWIDGSVSPAERDRIMKVARSRGIEEGGAADQQLSMWLDQRPSEELFRTAICAVRAAQETLLPSEIEASASSLLQSCADIAAASGGLLGLTTPVSSAEQKLLEGLARQLDLDLPMTARQVVSNIQTPRP